MSFNDPKHPHDPGCDCSNADCGLPQGRCYLCGNPYPHCSGTSGFEFTVCPTCAPKVEALYERECARHACFQRVRDGDVDEEFHGTPPWAPFDGDDAGAFCIQRFDVIDFFDSDESAALYVAAQLGIEPTYPEGA